MGHVDEIVDGIKEGVKKRLETPFLASFAISFVLTNYKLFLVIFGSGDYEKKIQYIDTILYPSGKLIPMGIFPFLAASIYTLAWPFAEANLAAFTVWNENRKRRLIQAQERVTPVPQHEMGMFMQAHNATNARLQEQLDSLHEATRAARKRNDEIVERLARRTEALAWGRLADSANVSASELKELLILGEKAPASSRHALNPDSIKPIAAAIAYILNIPVEFDRRTTTLRELQLNALDGYSMYALEVTVYVILGSLEIVGPLNENDESFSMHVVAQPRAERVQQIFSMLNHTPAQRITAQ
ncbi:hypothetical protein ACG02S_07720 [Roseateles sp. DC23W]|uniref:HTH cro/C1-type domain-containing protein n=1 Tax=Pelomonas dachongensis TaxID=3299029 RepID=A0ABW7EJY0_9BURK